MNPPDPDIATVAAAIGQPARASMLSALLAHEQLTVNELAHFGTVSPATASLHLARLAKVNLVAGHRSGRTHHYRLASVEVAHVLESLQRLALPAPVHSLVGSQAAQHIRFARSCYDHFAGRLGVAITDRLIDCGYLRAGSDAFSLTPDGESWLTSLRIDTTVLYTARRGLALSCLDWSERRPHVAGAVGAALLHRSLDAGWVSRRAGTRALRLTPVGARTFRQELGLEIQ